MSRLMVIVSTMMSAVMSLFSPLTIGHGDSGCCAECVLKKEEEVEIIHEEIQDKDD